MAAAMMLDLSAAFDLVNHSLLLQKLQLMGFGGLEIEWFSSYLDGRSQCVYIDGKLSDLVTVPVGVPQGSVLGALLYMLFVNELPTVIHDNPDEEPEYVGCSGQNHLDCCQRCGLLCCYVDDSTVSVSSDNPQDLTTRLSKVYTKLADYFGSNKLVINSEKTHLLVIGTRKHALIREQVTINTGSETIKPTESEKLLGLSIHQSLKWKEHVVAGKGSLLCSLTSRLNGLKKVAKNASFKTRLLIANACFNSVLTYMIVIWGGAEGYVIKMIQVMQNRAARIVTKQSWFTPTKVLLRQCNWLSIRQMVFLHSVIQIWKVLNNGGPRSIYSKLRITSTRSGQHGNLAITAHETSLGRNSFFVRALQMWNSTPQELRKEKSLQTFKRKLKQWIRANIEIE